MPKKQVFIGRNEDLVGGILAARRHKKHKRDFYHEGHEGHEVFFYRIYRMIGISGVEGDSLVLGRFAGVAGQHPVDQSWLCPFEASFFGPNPL